MAGSSALRSTARSAILKQVALDRVVWLRSDTQLRSVARASCAPSTLHVEHDAGSTFEERRLLKGSSLNRWTRPV